MHKGRSLPDGSQLRCRHCERVGWVTGMFLNFVGAFFSVDRWLQQVELTQRSEKFTKHYFLREVGFLYLFSVVGIQNLFDSATEIIKRLDLNQSQEKKCRCFNGLFSI